MQTLVKTDRRIIIDATVSVAELLDSWVYGNRVYVIATLKYDHPGLAAMFIIEGIKNHQLKTSDVNTVVNLLMDDRIDLLRETECYAE